MWLCSATMCRLCLRSVFSTVCTSGPAMMKSPATAAESSLPANAARVAGAADVHEVDLRLVEEEVVVQRRDFQAVGEGRVDGRGHFILEHHGVAHDHSTVRSGCESRPGAEAAERLPGRAVDLDRHIG